MRSKLLALAGLVLIAAAGTVAYATTRTTEAAPVAPATVAAKPADCCDDPTCPPGCDESCPPNCASVKTAKQSCCPDGPCCDGSDCCENVKAPAPAARKFTCPPCPFCPGF
jgi:hypothetical protein